VSEDYLLAGCTQEEINKKCIQAEGRNKIKPHGVTVICIVPIASHFEIPKQEINYNRE
jgi:hypothetical protein